ncbi:3-oxoacyl-[acyl-carrier-protein] synthase III C-terminal domain-containing protein [Vitiosangium sp. GDMCC 1.1324]|uniref:3-oxoacyl-[acyl-carrier-protein] synthase III C-terminal domain-containing protein n=1 Tax=Vitiosangium sp. (strain GDMCC 1.1324) TaxID=2138576 RepID=UPI000D3BC655|nr:3-oxoacyl-[acyl-carrier-protein] synthase III C-terminal domain-containing protein [Vitiosangium sp. GDMCC 1.1324]PTL80562.1 3-oxoacyl-ACP synthase [Vitiosangium sp. GDMCC 1.1324]
MTRPSISFLGFGAALPERVRTSADPIFDRIREAARAQGQSEASLFYGNREHRCLTPGESLASLTAKAGRAALEDAGVRPEWVDRLYGYVSVSEFITPNELYEVHRQAGLGPHVLVVPVQSDFANFLMGSVLAWEAILAGHSERALVAVGAGWTRNVDYAQGHAFGIGDGAGAAVLGFGERLVLVDYAAETFSDEYGAMTMRPRPEVGIDKPVYGLEPARGLHAFLNTGMDGPPRLVDRLLRKHGLTGDDITLVSHQATRKLLDHWNEKIRPREYLHTIEDCGNMALASIPVTLARHHRELRTKYLVLFGIGIGAHHMALLVRV